MQYKYTNTDEIQTAITISMSDLEILEKILVAINKQNIAWKKSHNLNDYPYTLDRLEKQISQCKLSAYEGTVNYINDRKIDS